MIRNIARRYLRAGLDVEDLVQEGSMGFIGALDNFDPDLGYSVGTLARFHVAARIQLHVSEFAGSIRLPNSRKIKGLLSQCVSRIRLAEAEKGEPLDASEKAKICEAAGFEFAELEQYEMVMRPSRSLSGASADGDESAFELRDENADVERLVLEKSSMESVARLLEELLAEMPERTARIVRLRHLSEDFVSLDAIGAEIGISRERVRRIEMKALRIIRERLAQAGLTRYDDVA
jgi:RNA polymerase sigma factor (sigma-70 family)